MEFTSICKIQDSWNIILKDDKVYIFNITLTKINSVSVSVSSANLRVWSKGGLFVHKASGLVTFMNFRSVLLKP